jgi:hypothetical protein
MGKKSEKLKEEAAIVAAKATKKTAKAPPKKKAAAKTTAAIQPKTVVSAAPKTAAKKLAFTNDDIALRAYFIAEKRHKAGLPGDAHQDWVEAERQLIAESKKKAPAKAGAAPKL